jgi:hypothetical protein
MQQRQQAICMTVRTASAAQHELTQGRMCCHTGACHNLHAWHAVDKLLLTVKNVQRPLKYSMWALMHASESLMWLFACCT